VIRGRDVVLPAVLALLAAGARAAPPAIDAPGATPADAAVAAPATEAAYVGAQACGECHRKEYRAWQDSHHAVAMQAAGARSVLGNFDHATFDYAGVATVFHRRDDKYSVTTDGPDGTPGEFGIRYTFGVAPLQQYLIALPGGRLQAFGVAWDSRPRAQGGQRWFHLYPGQSLKAGNPLHWTGRNQNWNFMCAGCHSTGVVKAYDAARDSYRTRWAELDVACEACHGPGRTHVAWARSGNRGAAEAAPGDGLAVHFDERDGVTWLPVPGAGHPKRSLPRTTRIEIDACGRCHARGTRLGDTARGPSLLDSHRPALLTPDQYWPDGQMRGEVFTWGSFLQSRMQAAGVTCSDCHEPHSLKLRASGNALCAQCHPAARYDRPAHTHHARDTPAGRCVTCHMPVTTFMQIDDRHDHSFRIPRPDRSIRLGVPNACNGCHRDRNPEWAAGTLRAWFPKTPTPTPDFADALDEAVTGAPGAREDLTRVIGNSAQPAIVRASAIEALAPWLTPANLPALVDAVRDPDPLVRMAAAGALARVDPSTQARDLGALLDDPVLAVRIEAATALAGAGERLLDAKRRSAFDAALGEAVASLRFNADRPDANVNLGNLYRRRGDSDAAATAYRRASSLDPRFVAAYVNLADLQREQGAESAARSTLRSGLERVPDSAELEHALGLALVREGRRDPALALLKQAADGDPATARYSQVLAVALHDWGRPKEACERLEGSLQRHPRDRDLLTTLAIYRLEAGERKAAQPLVRRLLELDPASPAARQLAARAGG
jgi:predicted CXXCH cytochrome family protein